MYKRGKNLFLCLTLSSLNPEQFDYLLCAIRIAKGISGISRRKTFLEELYLRLLEVNKLFDSPSDDDTRLAFSDIVCTDLPCGVDYYSKLGVADDAEGGAADEK